MDISCPVKGLEEGKEYEFRVAAENLHGTSEPLCAEPVVAKWPFSNDNAFFTLCCVQRKLARFLIIFYLQDPPSLTGTPICTDHTENSITLGWTKPRNDGGTPITGFMIEKREKGTDKWVP